MNSGILFALCLATLVAIAPLAWSERATAAGDPARGATLFQACMVCHSVKAGEHMTGPNLANVWQRRAGTVPGFHRYSNAMERAKLVWSDNTLDQWLRDPNALIPGTSMTFQGLRESKDRQDVIAYLKAVAEGRPPPTAQRGGGMMMSMAPAKVNLKDAPLEGQVVGISHCGDAYTVKTADGKVDKVWEFNLRLKTDTSELGPRPGKPVIVGAGMQGDRAAIVFAAPAEISGFIKESCP